MCFLFSLIPATVLTILGYFVWFSSTKTDGGIRTFGRVLAIWVFIVAALPPLMGLYVTMAGLCPVDRLLRSAPSG